MFVPSIFSSWEQKPEKSILNTFLLQCWIEKSCRQNQDRAKRWGNQFLNTFSLNLNIYIYTSFLLIWSVQQKDQEKCLCHLFCEKRVWNFTFWDVCAIYLVVMGTKAGEINLGIFFIQCWIEKSGRQNQDRAKRWGNQFLNTFLLEFIYIYIPFFCSYEACNKKIKKSICATSFAKSECAISHFEMFVPSI